MRFEPKPTGLHIMLEPGDHNFLGVAEIVDSIPLSSSQIPEIVKGLDHKIDESQIIFEGYRRARDSHMFEVHGEILTIRGLKDQIERYGSRARHPSSGAQYDRELYGSLHDEPVGQQVPPDLTIIRDISPRTPDFDPNGPSIA